MIYLMSLNILLSGLFARAYGGTIHDYAHSIVQATDGGYAVAGRTWSFGAGYVDLLVLKLNSTGAIQWARTFGGDTSDVASSIIQTTDGGYAVAGYTLSFGASYGSDDFLVIKLNSSGGLQWAKTFGGTSSDGALSIVQTADGGYAVAGWTMSFGAGNDDLLVIKISSAGDLQWARTFGGTGSEVAYSIVQTTDGGCAVAGFTTTYGAGDYDFLVIKLNSSGGLEWAKTFGGTSSDGAHSIIQTADGGYAVGGLTWGFGAGNADFLVLKLSGSGDLEWARTFGGANHENLWSIVQAKDGGYAVAGRTQSFGAGSGDFFVLKLSGSGSLEWARTLGGTNLDEAQSIVQTTDEGYAVAGYTYSFGAGSYDLLVLKLGPDGSYPGCVADCSPTVNTPTPSTSSPSVGANCNPTVIDQTPTSTTPSLTTTDACAPLYVEEDLFGKGFEFRALGHGIYLYIPEQAQVSLKIYDAGGRLVQRLYEGVLTSGSHTFSPEIEGRGVYLAVLGYNGSTITTRILR